MNWLCKFYGLLLLLDHKSKTFENLFVCVDDLAGTFLLLDGKSCLSKASHQCSSVFKSFSHVFKSSAVCGEGGFVPGEGGHGDFEEGVPVLHQCRFDMTLKLLS